MAVVFAGDQVIDDHFLERYRALLDAEEMAFDELQHAFEDGDRSHLEADLVTWTKAASARHTWLASHGVLPA